MPGRVLIVAPQIAPESLPWRLIADAARAEGLEAHARAVECRLEALGLGAGDAEAGAVEAKR